MAIFFISFPVNALDLFDTAGDVNEVMPLIGPTVARHLSIRTDAVTIFHYTSRPYKSANSEDVFLVPFLCVSIAVTADFFNRITVKK